MSGARGGLRRLRSGELLALAGAICVIVSLFVRSYATPIGDLNAWDTFGPAVVLEIAAVFAALAMVVSALTERTTALPVATAVWCVPLGLLGVIAAIVRCSSAPNTRAPLCAGGWLALAGPLAILARRLAGRCATNDPRCIGRRPAAAATVARAVSRQAPPGATLSSIECRHCDRTRGGSARGAAGAAGAGRG